MSSWVNRTVLSGASVNKNGTNSHTCTFAPAVAGNFLVAVVSGSVTFSTPSGWTLGDFAVADSGLYVFFKVAGVGETSFSTTHNASDYAIRGVVYEFAAGSDFISGNSVPNQNAVATGPQVTGLSGTYTRFAARAWNMSEVGSSGSCAWTLPTTEDYDTYIAQETNDGIMLTIAYDDNATGASFNPSSTATINSGSSYGEGIAFALSVVPPANPIASYGFNAMGTAGGTASVSSTINDDSGNGNTLVVQNSGMGIVSGHHGVGVEGDGSTYAQVASTSAIKPTTAVTWMCWARVTGNTYGWGQIFGRCNDDTAWGDAFSMYLNSDERATYRFDAVVTTDYGRTHGTNASTVLTLNTWVHIAATWSAADGNVRVYINGSEVCSISRDGATLLYGTGGNTTRHFNIYQNEQYNEHGNQIQIDEVRVFDKQLTTAEITTWMNAPIEVASLVGFPWLTGINS